MSLKDDKQQNIRRQLDFSSALTGEAREAGREGTESAGAMNGTENPASTNRLMEEVCERENLKAALRRVKANKGSPGVDGMTVVGIKDYLKQHWPAISRTAVYGPVRTVVWQGSAGDRRPYADHCKTWHESGAGLSPRGWRPGFLESKLLPYGKKPPGYARKMTIAGVPTSVYRPANVRAPFWRFTRNAAMASAL
jgi:hypothetical protein